MLKGNPRVKTNESNETTDYTICSNCLFWFDFRNIVILADSYRAFIRIFSVLSLERGNRDLEEYGKRRRIKSLQPR